MKKSEAIPVPKTDIKPPASEHVTGGVGTTRLVITIEEDRFGSVHADWEATLKETGERYMMRPTHIVGQIEVAKGLVKKRYYGDSKKE